MRPVLLLQLGEPPASVSAAFGPFPGWYERVWGASLTVFHGLPSPLTVNLTHEDDIDPDTFSGTLLAQNEQTPIQALAVGDATRGVQFHPEIDGRILASYVDARRAVLPKPDSIRALDAPEGAQVLRNFRRFYVDKA